MCIIASTPDTEVRESDLTGRIHVEGQQGETHWRTEEWIGQTDICKSQPNISGNSISCGVSYTWNVQGERLSMLLGITYS